MRRLRDYGLMSIPLAFLILLVSCLTVPVQAATSWNVQTVDANGAGVGNGYCPIKLDSGGTPHIAYSDDVEGGFLAMHARWNGSGWSTQEIASGYVTDIALDAHNNPHILYETGVYGGLMYAVWTGSNWGIQTVSTNRTVYASLALDSSGNPHAAYSDGTSVKYASRNNSTWTIQTVDTAAEIPFQVYLALDSNDIPSILYSLGDHVKLAVWASSGWNIQTIVSNVSGFGNLVLDSKGQPHFVYSVGATTIMYASWNGVAWTYQSVVSNVKWLEQGSGLAFLALDTLDYPHISYLTAETATTGPELMYAAWTGTAWNIQTAAPGDGPPYLAVDSNRIPHISYYIGGGGPGYFANIMYATATEPVPLSSPTPILPLMVVATAIIIVAVVAVVVYVWKKKS